MSKFTYCQFIHPISAPKHGSINGWSSDKHADIELELANNWVILTLPDKTKRRVPITNVAFLSERADDDEPKAKGTK